MNVAHMSKDINTQTMDKRALIRVLVILNLVCYLGFAVYVIMPYWMYNQSYILLGGILGCWFLTFLLVCISRFQFHVYNIFNKSLRFLTFLWLPYVFILRFIGFSTSSWGNFFVYALFWFSYFAFCFYDGLLSIKNKRKIVITIVVIYALNAIDNIRLLIQYPNANKLINFYDSYKQFNIGGTTFAFELALCALICQFLFINNSKYKRTLLSVYILNGIYLFVFSGKTTSIVLFVCASLTMWIFNNINKFEKKARVMLFAEYIVFAGITLLGGSLIFRLIGENLSSFDLKIRFFSMADFFENLYSGKVVINEYLSRIDLAKLSLKSFASSPIIGIGKHFVDQQRYGLNAVYEIGIGSHSELIDHLAVYGIIGLVSYIILFKNYFATLFKKCVAKSNRVLYKTILFFIVVYSVCNNSFSMGCGILMFIMLPFAIDIVNERSSSDDKVKRKSSD